MNLNSLSVTVLKCRSYESISNNTAQHEAHSFCVICISCNTSSAQAKDLSVRKDILGP